MDRSRRGASPVGIVVGLVIVAAIVFAVLFFASDVFRTRTKTVYRQFSEWTPENIARDPVNYLNFCEEQTRQALMKLKASEIAISQKKAKIETMRGEAAGKIDLGRKALEELKVEYKKRDADNSWPLTWRSATLDKEQCKRQILRFASETRGKEDLIRKLEQATGQLQTQTRKVQDARDMAQDQLTKIDTSREILKVQQITDDLKNNLVAMKATIEGSVVGVASAETGTLSLDDLASASETTVDEGEFAKIMSE